MISGENIEQIMKNLNALRGLTKIDDLNNRENNILLLQNSWRFIKDFYKKGFASEQPLNKTIQNFVANKTFLSSSYFDKKGESLIRQFFITEESSLDFQRHYVSTIPITDETFFKPSFFQSQSLYDDNTAFQRTCLRNQVEGTDVSVINCASSSRKILQNNIYTMKHRFLGTEGELLILNKIGLIEIFCERGFLIFKNTGFTIITISSDCKVHFNAHLLLQNNVFTFGLKPTVIYQLKHLLSFLVWVYLFVPVA